MKYWILKCNPDYYRLDERLADPEPRITWSISRYRDDVHAYDMAFIWETGKRRGIRATIRIDSEPQEMPELESEVKYQTTPDTSLAWRVYATILLRDLHVSADKLRAVPGLEALSVFHGYRQSTVYPVSDDEAAILLRLIEDETA